MMMTYIRIESISGMLFSRMGERSTEEFGKSEDSFHGHRGGMFTRRSEKDAVSEAETADVFLSTVGCERCHLPPNVTIYGNLLEPHPNSITFASRLSQK